MPTQKEVEHMIIGMIMKGKIPTDKNKYSPRCWNDTGDFTHVYIDFKVPIGAVTYGMMSSSLYLISSNGMNIAYNSIERINNTTFKLTCNDLSSNTQGIYLIGKEETFVQNEYGRFIQSFTVKMLVSGVSSYDDAGYCLDQVNGIGFSTIFGNNTESAGCNYTDNHVMDGNIESEIFTHPAFNFTATETATITYN
jgi:hypothetical protein